MTQTTCPVCDEDTLAIDDGAKCTNSACSYSATGQEAALKYTEEVLRVYRVKEIQDGGIDPIQYCPSCGNESLVMRGMEHDPAALCFSCGDTYTDIVSCDRCGEIMDGSSDFGMCSDCMSRA